MSCLEIKVKVMRTRNAPELANSQEELFDYMHMACDDTCFSENNQYLHDKLTKMSKFSFSV